ncbi:hypothetical protein B0T16DRAFT_166015 [Cercophora newfieldiana]|uniref:Uncharacterized protein n=1 Tax=Cercophora newfieldiana TaxID=92897 RepID=A0AA39Y5V8_9PEZI|nr:hypothetical protein B0T16DRAFT_166015 [Cercophora newfieldiana]
MEVAMGVGAHAGIPSWRCLSVCLSLRSVLSTKTPRLSLSTFASPSLSSIHRASTSAGRWLHVASIAGSAPTVTLLFAFYTPALAWSPPGPALSLDSQCCFDDAARLTTTTPSHVPHVPPRSIPSPCHITSQQVVARAGAAMVLWSRDASPPFSTWPPQGRRRHPGLWLRRLDAVVYPSVLDRIHVAPQPAAGSLRSYHG